MKKLIRQSFLFALGEASYISLVAVLMFGIQKWFGAKPDPKIIAPIFLLLLFVISAAVSGALILGKPLMLYLDGRKKEALELFAMIVGWLVAFLILAFIVIATR